MRKTYFFMAFWALAFGISGCGDITCKPGESYCNDSKTRMVCKSNGDLNFETCSAGCDFNTGLCILGKSDLKPDCQDNTYKCGIVADRAVSQQCSGGNWISYTCDNGCDAATGRCKESTCTHGEYQCDANVSNVCLNGKWVFEEACGYGCDADTGKCNMKYIPGECTIGRYKCVGNNSYLCTEYNGWELYAPCSYGSYACDEDTGKCEASNANPPSVECTTGSYKCEDNISYRCTDYGYGWDLYDYCPYECDKKTGKCTELCEPGGTIYCQKTCNASRSEGYYYARGTVHTVECSNYGCTIENDRVECKDNNFCYQKEYDCYDGVDNDCDGRIDDNDYDCQRRGLRRT